MTQTIWKFDLGIADEQVLFMQKGAEILDVQVQNGGVKLWALVNPEAKICHRKINIAGTGHDLTDRVMGKFIGVVQMLNGNLIWHVFDGGEV